MSFLGLIASFNHDLLKLPWLLPFLQLHGSLSTPYPSMGGEILGEAFSHPGSVKAIRVLSQRWRV
jgi:hypothetical protein